MSAFLSSCFQVSAFWMNRTPFEIEGRNFLHIAQNSPESEIKTSGGHLRIRGTRYVRISVLVLPSLGFLDESDTVRDRATKFFALCSEFTREWDRDEWGAPPHLRYEECPPVSKFRLFLMIRTPFKIGRRNFLHFAQNSPENEIQIEGGHLHIWNTRHVRLMKGLSHENQVAKGLRHVHRLHLNTSSSRIYLPSKNLSRSAKDINAIPNDILMSTAIPRWKHRFSSDHRS